MTELDPTKSRLLEAAGEEFAERGFDGATIRGICARADVKNLAAVNYYFGDKEQLYTQALIEAHRRGMPTEAEMAEAFARESEPADRLRGFIRRFLRDVLAMSRRQDWQDKLMLREMFQPTSASGTLAREVIRPKFERLVQVFREICPEADLRRLHLLAFSVIGQCLHYKMACPISEHLVGKDEFATFDLDLLSEHIAGFSLAALGLAGPIGLDGRSVPLEPVEGRGGADS